MRTIVGVIPSRWGSTRFPGKSLHPLLGRPLLAWVVARARQARMLSRLLVATDDERIRAAAAGLGVDVVLTSPDHPSGTDRIAEAVRGIPADVVLNIQGDEPLADPALMDELVQALAGHPEWDMATAAAPLTDPRDLNAPSVVKVVRDRSDRALYFSRATIPCRREKDTGAGAAEGLYYRHIGLYAYQRAFMEQLVATPPCALEQAEKLEQLRALWLGGRIKVLTAHDTGVGVDTPEDAVRVEAEMRRRGWAAPEKGQGT